MAFTTHLSILDGLRRQDETAWDRFFQEYRPLMRLHGRDCGVPEDHLDDLEQEVLLALTRRCAVDFDGSRGHFRCFLRGIIRNKAHEFRRQFYRDRQMEKTLLEAESDEVEFCEFQIQEWSGQIEEQVMTLLQHLLVPLHFQIFDLLILRSWSPYQVAGYLNIPLSTVYSIRSRTMHKLKKLRGVLRKEYESWQFR